VCPDHLLYAGAGQRGTAEWERSKAARSHARSALECVKWMVGKGDMHVGEHVVMPDI
jgi:hypothetical protein